MSSQEVETENIHLESVAFEESQHFTEGNRMELREDLHLSSSLALPGVLPDQLDGVGLDVRHAELSHLEDRREDGALQGAASGHGLVSVQSGAGSLPEHGLDHRLDGGDTRAASNDLNTANSEN